MLVRRPGAHGSRLIGRAPLEDTIENRRGQIGVVEHPPPIVDRLVCGEEHRPFAQGPIVDHVVEHVGGLGAVGEIAHLVDHQDVRMRVAPRGPRAGALSDPRLRGLRSAARRWAYQSPGEISAAASRKCSFQPGSLQAGAKHGDIRHKFQVLEIWSSRSPGLARAELVTGGPSHSTGCASGGYLPRRRLRERFATSLIIDFSSRMRFSRARGCSCHPVGS